MSILGDVYKVYESVDVAIKIFGCRKGFKLECDKHFKQIGEVIAMEQNVILEKAKSLPKGTELGEEAEEEFKKLKQWLYSQDSSFDF